MSDTAAYLRLIRCPGCFRRFGSVVEVALWLPHLIDFNDEEHPVVTTRFPACEACARAWCDGNEAAEAWMDRVASEWMKMDALLKRVEADGII